MKVHIAFDEKFSSGFFARFEFLHSLQVIFQFINTTSVLGIGKFFGSELSFFGFSRVVPFPPAAINGLFKFIFVSVHLLPQQKFIQNIKAVKFHSVEQNQTFFRKPMKFAHCPFP